MKICPKCKSSYADESLIFCLSDGTSLIPDKDSSPETLVFPSQPTLRQNAETSRTSANGKTNRQFVYTGIAAALVICGIAVSLLAAFGWSRFSDDGAAMRKDSATGQTPADVKTSSSPVAAPVRNDELETFAPCDSSEARKIQTAKIEFFPASYKVTPASREVLRRTAEDFRQLAKNCQLEIAVHTDKGGNEAMNIDLTQKRAEAVKTELAAFGVETDRLTTRGYGSSNPLAGGTSDEARRRNNRTEFKLFTK